MIFIPCIVFTSQPLMVGNGHLVGLGEEAVVLSIVLRCDISESRTWMVTVMKRIDELIISCHEILLASNTILA